MCNRKKRTTVDRKSEMADFLVNEWKESSSTRGKSASTKTGWNSLWLEEIKYGCIANVLAKTNPRVRLRIKVPNLYDPSIPINETHTNKKATFSGDWPITYRIPTV